MSNEDGLTTLGWVLLVVGEVGFLALLMYGFHVLFAGPPWPWQKYDLPNNIVRLTQADDGSGRFRYRDYEFALVWNDKKWWCHSGYRYIGHDNKRDDDGFPRYTKGLLSTCHEAGWATGGRKEKAFKKILRKITWSIDRDIEKDRRDEQVNNNKVGGAA